MIQHQFSSNDHPNSFILIKGSLLNHANCINLESNLEFKKNANIHHFGEGKNLFDFIKQKLSNNMLYDVSLKMLSKKSK